jgi:hypothetical protein
MIKKLDAFLSWFIKEGLTLIIFIGIVMVIGYALYHLFNSPNI